MAEITKEFEAEIKKIREEVAYFDSWIIDDLINSDKQGDVDELYCGYQVFYSPIRCNPDVMFIGINPGAGYLNTNGKRPKDEPMEEFEYTSKNGGYMLAENWKDIFSSNTLNHDGKFNCIDDVLKYAVKINCYPFATRDSKDLKALKNLLLINHRDFECYHEPALQVEEKSKEWATKIIKLVNPKILICEGFGAFDKVKEWFGSEFTMRENEVSPAEEKDFKAGNIGNILVFGVRRTFSTICNHELVEEKIDEYL